MKHQRIPAADVDRTAEWNWKDRGVGKEMELQGWMNDLPSYLKDGCQRGFDLIKVQEFLEAKARMIPN